MSSTIPKNPGGTINAVAGGPNAITTAVTASRLGIPNLPRDVGVNRVWDKHTETSKTWAKLVQDSGNTRFCSPKLHRFENKVDAKKKTSIFHYDYETLHRHFFKEFGGLVVGGFVCTAVIKAYQIDPSFMSYGMAVFSGAAAYLMSGNILQRLFKINDSAHEIKSAKKFLKIEKKSLHDQSRIKEYLKLELAQNPESFIRLIEAMDVQIRKSFEDLRDQLSQKIAELNEVLVKRDTAKFATKSNMNLTRAAHDSVTKRLNAEITKWKVLKYFGINLANERMPEVTISRELALIDAAEHALADLSRSFASPNTLDSLDGALAISTLSAESTEGEFAVESGQSANPADPNSETFFDHLSQIFFTQLHQK